MTFSSLHVDGTILRNEAGVETSVVAVDFFSLLSRWVMASGPTALVGPKLDEIRAVATEAGYTGPIWLRAFRHAATWNPFALDPHDHQDYYDQAAACTDFCGERNFGVMWTGGDAQVIFPSADPGKANLDGPLGLNQHTNDFTSKVILGRKNVMWQSLNEPFKNGQVLPNVPQWDPARPYLRDSGAFGNYAGNDPNSWPFASDLDIVDWHGGRQGGDPLEGHPLVTPKWNFKMAESATVIRTITQKPFIFWEEMGFDDVASGSRSNVPDEAFQMAAAGVAYASGVCCHSTDGAFGNGYKPITRACHVAFFKGATLTRR